jgi:hypothetical protein
MQGLSKTSMAVELLPSLLSVIRPAITGGSLHTLSMAEKDALRSVVTVMHDYGLSYEQKFDSQSGLQVRSHIIFRR